MTYKTMLAYIAPRLTQQVENVATEALLYLLRRYPIASESFISYVAKLGIRLPENLIFDTQMIMEGRAIPDLTGCDEDGQHVLMVESKFWASLTKNQPIAYLDRLPPDKEAILLFIAPSSRFPTLWPELVQRCTEAGLSVEQKKDQSLEYFVAEVKPGKLLGLISWESLLSYLRDELKFAGAVAGEYEVWQLQGLCERLDAEAFHPLQAEDLKSTSDLRVEEYQQLVDDLVRILVEKNYASIKDYRATPGAEYYKRYMTLFGIKNWCVEYNATYWRRFQRTPIWLTLSLSYESTTQSIEKLSPLREESPFRLIEDGKQVLIPLKLPVDVERENVLRSLVHQIEEMEPFIGT